LTILPISEWLVAIPFLKQSCLLYPFASTKPQLILRQGGAQHRLIVFTNGIELRMKCIGRRVDGGCDASVG
jgi:hypothetical protein